MNKGMLPDGQDNARFILIFIVVNYLASSSQFVVFDS